MALARAGRFTTLYTSFGPDGQQRFRDAPFFRTRSPTATATSLEYRFNQLGNVVRTIQFTRACASANRRATRTVLPTTVTARSGARTRNWTLRNTRSTQAILTACNRGIFLQVCRLPGRRGGDQPQLVTSMTYEPNFNFVASSTDARGAPPPRTLTTNTATAPTPCIASPASPSAEYNAFGQVTRTSGRTTAAGIGGATCSHLRIARRAATFSSRPRCRADQLQPDHDLRTRRRGQRGPASCDLGAATTRFTPSNASNQVVREQWRPVDTTNASRPATSATSSTTPTPTSSAATWRTAMKPGRTGAGEPGVHHHLRLRHSRRPPQHYSR